ncbi:uncharacterized protein LOC125827609 [Solanum verrucosum]|uniref:uncharacterized protein LOC125827609 n=1 Tax=Solanum verrucosum TaxID=315347 RepID=UPI0020D02D8B|nr:uncharacterized protein LOC125827609 [Solanum verrucosum]
MLLLKLVKVTSENKQADFLIEVDRTASFSGFDLFHHLSTMRPLSPSAPPPGWMSSYGTDEEIFLVLNQINRGSPIPDDLIEDNPYKYDPSNLPDGAWFLVRKTEEKSTEYGLWRVKDSACEIFANSDISGWRTTFEFFLVQASIEQKTVCIMHEYKVTPKGQHDLTKSQVIFNELMVWLNILQDEVRHLLGYVILIPSVNPDTSGNDGQRSIAEPQVNRQIEGAGSSLVDKSIDQFVDDKEAEIDCIIRGDYLELDDLIDGASHDSSSSENTSRQSFASDEFFNSRALLAELDDEKKEDLSGKGSTSNHSIMMCQIANDVVVQPGPLGFLIKGSDAKAKETQQAPDNDKSKCQDQAAKKLKAERTDEGPSHARRATTSSSSSNSSSDEPGRAARREAKRSKKLMKFLCFMPF